MSGDSRDWARRGERTRQGSRKVSYVARTQRPRAGSDLTSLPGIPDISMYFNVVLFLSEVCGTTRNLQSSRLFVPRSRHTQGLCFVNLQGLIVSVSSLGKRMSSLVTPSPSLGPSASGQQDYPSPSSGELRDSSPEVKKPLSPSLEITALDISTTTPETDHLQHGDSLLSPVAPSSAAPDAAHGPPRPRLLESPPAPIEIPLASIAMVTHVTATESPTALSPKEFATLAAIPTGASPRQTSLSLLTRSSSNATTGAGVTKYKMGSVSTESHFPPAHSHSSPRASLLKLFTEESRSASIVGGNLAGAIGKRTSIEEIRPGSTTTTPLPRGAQPSRSSSTASPTTPMPTSLLKDAPSSKRLTWSRSDKEVLIGTPVKEGHSNYILMYDMLTGIRISVCLLEFSLLFCILTHALLHIGLAMYGKGPSGTH